MLTSIDIITWERIPDLGTDHFKIGGGSAGSPGFCYRNVLEECVYTVVVMNEQVGRFGGGSVVTLAAIFNDRQSEFARSNQFNCQNV